ACPGRGRDPFGVGAPVVLDDEPAETEESAAVHATYVEPCPEAAERIVSKQRAKAIEQRRTHRLAEIANDLTRRPLGGLQRDVAGEAFGDDDVYVSLGYVIAFDKANIVEV